MGSSSDGGRGFVELKVKITRVAKQRLEYALKCRKGTDLHMTQAIIVDEQLKKLPRHPNESVPRTKKRSTRKEHTAAA